MTTEKVNSMYVLRVRLIGTSTIVWNNIWHIYNSNFAIMWHEYNWIKKMNEFQHMRSKPYVAKW